jgi:hypothetical protein
VRVVGIDADESRAYARNHAFGVGRAASFRDTDREPAGVELVLAALGGDLASGCHGEAARRGIEIEALEVTLGCRLDNPLQHLAVMGETGSPGLASLTGTLYVTAAAPDAALASVWQHVLDHSPLFVTLSRAVNVVLEFRIVR